MGEDGAVPVGPSLTGGEVGGAGRDELEVGVGPLHELGAFEGELSVVFGRAVAHLPGAVHLVAKPPILHFPGLFAAVPAPQFSHGGACGEVAVLDPLLGFDPGAGPEIGADIRLDAEQFDVVQEVVSAEAVVFDGLPGHVETLGALVAGADAIHPVVVGREVASGPAQKPHVQVADGFDDVAAVAVGVGKRRALVENAALDATAEVLGEVAVDLGIDGPDHALGIDADASGERARLAAKQKGGSRQGGGELTPGDHGIAPYFCP